MSRSTISTYAVFKMFPTPESARLYLEGRLWGENGPMCPECKTRDMITVRKDGFYRCNNCKDYDFTIRTGTIFERSHIPLNKWMYAMYLLVTARKGISSMQLAKEIGVTQKSAWFMLSRLREACGNDADIDQLRGTVEADECFVGGIESNKHESKKLRAGRGPVGKVPVLGIRERGGRTFARVIRSRTIQEIQGLIFDRVEVGSTVFTDDHLAYSGMDGLFFRHETVNHSIGEYVRGPVHTNSVESVWAVLKRGLHGVYHHASKKHLGRYVAEFSWRLNEGNVKRHSFERLAAFVDAVVGKRLTYKTLTAEVSA